MERASPATLGKRSVLFSEKQARFRQSEAHYSSYFKKGCLDMAHPEHLQFLNPATLSAPPGYSHIVKVTGGQTIYIAGQVALDASGNLVGEGDFAAQAVQVFENLRTALAAAGTDFNAVVKITIYVVDCSELPLLREIRDRYINTQTPPASTLVEVTSLAQDEFLLEIEAIASLPA